MNLLSKNVNADQLHTSNRAYDLRSRLTQLTYPDGSVVDRTYTDRNQLHTVKWNNNLVHTRTYDAGARLATTTHGNGVVSTFGYRQSGANKDNLLASIETPLVAGATNGVGDYSYTYDANKNKTSESITGTLSDYGFGTGSGGSTVYDDEDRLTTWKRSDGNLDRSWDLSKVGDWKSVTENGATENRTHTPAHEIATIAPAGSQPAAVSHDAKGNLTVRPAFQPDPHQPPASTAFVWDFDNRLASATVPSGSSGIEGTHTYTYDATGRRVSKVVDDATANGGAGQTTTTLFVCSDQQVICEYTVAPTNTIDVNSPEQQYVYASYIDEPILKDGTFATGTGIVYYHRNQQYSITALTDSTGTVVERYAYSPYGETTILDGVGTVLPATAFGNRYTYTGRRFDAETGLFYFRARMYSPTLGRFISRDPLGFVDGMSLYYGFFVPSGLDPTGTDWFGTGDCGRKYTNKFKLSLSFMSKGEKPDPLYLGTIFQNSRFPVAVSWNMASGGTITTQDCWKCCGDSHKVEYKKESISAFLTGQISFKLKAPNLAFKVKGAIGLVANGKMKREGPDCFGKTKMEGCITVKLSGNVKLCIEDPAGFLSGCVGIKASGGIKNCGDGWKWTGGDFEVYGEACAVWGIYCHQQPIWSPTGGSDSDPVFLD